MPHTPLLIPGYGAQGGTAADIRPASSAVAATPSRASALRCSSKPPSTVAPTAKGRAGLPSIAISAVPRCPVPLTTPVNAMRLLASAATGGGILAALAPAPNDFTFHWAIGALIGRYRALLATDASN